MSETHYKVVADEAALLDYIDWLPELPDHEQFYLCLFGRKKYCPELPNIKTDKSQLKRFTSRKEMMFKKIKQLECPLGFYTQKSEIIPQHALALYITPNPRDLWKAIPNAIIDLTRMIICEGRSANLHQEVMSTIQRSPGKKRWTMFDIDSKEQHILDHILKIAGPHCDIIETRGGYHVYVRADEMPKKPVDGKHWYQEIQQYADQRSKADLSPVVGCYQGGFVPRFIHRTSKRKSDSGTQIE